MAMELARVCQDLDKRAVLCDKTLEDDVLEPIDFSSLRLSLHRKKSSERRRPERRSRVYDQKGGVKETTGDNN